MYLPAHFEESRIDVLQTFIQQHDLATLATFNGSALQADHLPFELDIAAGPFGTLRGHVARANPLWHATDSSIDALAIFQGAQAYVSPSWYPSKQLHGKVVPTFNYIVVHASGPLRVIDDPRWLRALLERLTQRHETNLLNTGTKPWQVSDAPGDYLEQNLQAIVGIEIPLTALIGKWKVSQNRSAQDRAGVVEGLRAMGADQVMIDAVASKK